jgi:hypothetical protein
VELQPGIPQGKSSQRGRTRNIHHEGHEGHEGFGVQRVAHDKAFLTAEKQSVQVVQNVQTVQVV